MKKIILLMLVTSALFTSCQKSGDDPHISEEEIITDVEGNIFLYYSPPQMPSAVGLTVYCGDQSLTISSGVHFSFKNVRVKKDFAQIVIKSGQDVIALRTFQPHPVHNFLNMRQAFGGGGGINHSFSNSADYEFIDHLSFQIPANTFSGATTAFTWIELDTQIGSSPFPKEAIPGSNLSISPDGIVNGLRFASHSFYLSFKNEQGQFQNLPATKSLLISKSSGGISTGTGPFFLFKLNEQTGLWKKISDASLIGNGFSTAFSAETQDVNGYFVFAEQYDVVKFQARLLTPTGIPIFSRYRINKVTDAFTYQIGYSNRDGFINGYIPKGEEIQLELLHSNIYFLDYLTPPIFKRQLGIQNSEKDLGDVVCISNLDSTKGAIVTYTGKLVDCNGSPLPDHIITNNGFFTSFPDSRTKSDGSFAISYTRSQTAYNFYQITILNPVTGEKTQQMEPIWNKKNAASTLFEMGEVKLCNTSTEEYIRLKIDDQLYEFTPPNVGLSFDFSAGAGPIEGASGVEQIGTTSGTPFKTSFYGNKNVGEKIGASFTFQPLQTFHWINGVKLTITENRNMGSFYLKGRMENSVVQLVDGTFRTVSCDFRVKN